MKKISLVALLLATAGGAVSAAETLVPGCPKAFQGFHLGGNIGYGVGVANQKFDGTTGVVHTNSKNNLGIKGVDGGIGVGYTHRLGNWALGLAFVANWASSKGQLTTAFDSNTAAANRVKGTRTLKGRLKNALQLYARTGYVIGGQVMPFIGLGWDNASWNQSISETQTNAAGVPHTFSQSRSKRLNGFMWKLGVDFLATKHVVLGFEYTGTIYGKKTFKEVNTVGGETIAASFRPQYNKFALTAKIVY
ncbi:MAG: outer membrane beta-barrel protein [Alphaproteobacteria bacterium]|nr:outer membrane beta-barrel protein [Alphaproteobacteria bacterium]